MVSRQETTSVIMVDFKKHLKKNKPLELGSVNLHKDQRLNILEMLNRRVGCITSDCGGGKTVMGLTAYEVVRREKPKRKMLVVCSPKGAKETWSKEHTHWSHLSHLRVAALVGTPAQRKKLLEDDHDVYVITYNSLKWLLDNCKLPFHFVYADEGDCLKSPTSKWRDYLNGLAKKSKYRIVATATPKAKDEDDYWGICHFLDGGKAIKAKTYEVFCAKYCSAITLPGIRTTLYKIKKNKIKKIEKLITPLFFNFESEDTVKVPIKVVTVNANLSKKSQKKYDKLVDEQCLNSLIYNKEERTAKDGTPYVATIKDSDKSLPAAVLSGKLAQLVSGFIYMNEHNRISLKTLKKATNLKQLIKDNKERYAVDVFDDRIKAFGKLVKYARKKHKSNVAITYTFKHEREQLLRLYPNALTDTDKDFVEKWNTGKHKYLLLQYQRSGKSLNLQLGGHVMAMYSPTWQWVNDYQIVRRLARQGQPELMVYCYRLYMRNTIDDVKAKRLDERFQGHSRFQKKILKRAQK